MPANGCGGGAEREGGGGARSEGDAGSGECPPTGLVGCPQTGCWFGYSSMEDVGFGGGKFSMKGGDTALAMWWLLLLLPP
jgi:hypothetical protein